MKKFIFKIAIFLLPVLITACLIDYLFSKKLRESRLNEFSTWEDIYNGEINADIAIYGSSRAVDNINPIVFEKETHKTAYNLGMVGQHIWLQNLRHIEYLKHNRKPKVVIYALDDFLFSDPIGVYLPDQFSPYILWKNPEIKKQLSVYKYQPFSYFDYKIPLLRYIDSYYTNKVKQFFPKLITRYTAKLTHNNNIPTSTTNEQPLINNISTNIRLKGYSANNLTWNSDFDKALLSKGHFNATINQKGILLFENLITELKQKGTYIIFVIPPEYIDGQKFTTNRDQIIGIYNKISQKYQIPLYDYSNDSMSYDKKFFYNSLHLNATGAEIFSKNFFQDIKTILNKKLN